MLKEEDDAHALATNMDIGLAYVDLKRRKVIFRREDRAVLL